MTDRCTSLGFVNNPKHGVFRTVRTCTKLVNQPACQIIAAAEVQNNGETVTLVDPVNVVSAVSGGVGITDVTLNTSVTGSATRYVQATASGTAADTTLSVRFTSAAQNVIRVTAYTAGMLAASDYFITVMEC